MSKDWNCSNTSTTDDYSKNKTKHNNNRIAPKCLSWPSENSKSGSEAAATGVHNYNNNNNNNNTNTNSTDSAVGVATKTSIASTVSSSSTTAGVKRKQKRRRTQAMSKGKSIASQHGKKTQNTSVWDTDFDGAWEMGPDLIREFVIKQNNRNRSISESDASKFIEMPSSKRASPAKSGGIDAKQCENNQVDENTSGTMLIRNMLQISNRNDQNVIKNFSIDAAVANKTLVAELNDSSILMVGNKIANNENEHHAEHRRLYEREVSDDESLTPSGISADEAHNMAIFEAKFDRNVEALWDNTNATAVTSLQPQTTNSTNVDSFWFNYYKHHYNNSKAPAAVADSGQFNLSFFDKMDTNYHQTDAAAASSLNYFDQQQSISASFMTGNGNKRDAKKLHCDSNSVYLTNSIWSDTGAATNAVTTTNPNEDDVSFYPNSVMWSTGANATTSTNMASNINAVVNASQVRENNFYYF